MDGNSAAVSNSARISLPEGTTKIRFTHTGTRYRVSFGASLYYELHPTTHLLELIGDRSTFYLMNFDSAFAMNKDDIIRTNPSGSTYNGSYASIIENSDQIQYGQRVSHDYARNLYNSLTPYSSCTKTSSSPVSDMANSQETVEYTLTYNEYVNYSSLLFTQQDILELDIIHEQRESVFYDLLPIGTTIDASSVRAATYTARSNHRDLNCDATLETVENWRGTGRTMLKIHVTAPANVKNFDRIYINSVLCSGFTVTFTLINTWQNIGDYGKIVRNSSAYYSMDGPLVGGFADTGGNITEKELFKDLDGDGNLSDALKNVTYAECTTTFNPLIAAQLGFKKSVRAADELRYGDSAKVSAAGTYTYQLRFANDKNVNTNDVVIYDILESAYGNNQHWKGTLKSINTAQPESKGIKPITYYSVSSEFESMMENNAFKNLANTAVWSTTPPENLAKVTAIAIDLRHKADGSEYVFTPEETALCYITMTAPEDYQNYVDNPQTPENETVYAYNSAYLQGTATPVSGEAGKSSFDECETVTVSIRSPEIEIHKISDPESGTEEQPTVVNVGGTITYHLSVANKGKAEAIYNLSVEDVIPDGLPIQDDQIKYAFGNTAASPAPVAGSARVSVQQEEQKLTFTLNKLDAGETVHLLIPVVVDESANVGMIFENTAALTKFNGKNWNIESETTWHKTESEYGYELPNTGGRGVYGIYLFGSLAVMLAGFAIYGKRRE